MPTLFSFFNCRRISEIYKVGNSALSPAQPSALHPPTEGRSQTPHHPICKHWSVLGALLGAGFCFDVQSPMGVLVSLREVAGLCPMLGTCGPRRAPEQPPLSSSDLVNGLVALMNSNVSSPVNLVSPSLCPLPPQQAASCLAHWPAAHLGNVPVCCLPSTRGRSTE